MTDDDRGLKALKCIADGDSIDVAAYKMRLSRSSVEKYLSEVRKRLGAVTLANAVSIAIRAGMICLTVWVNFHGDGDDMRRPRRSRRDDSAVHLSQDIDSDAD